ncbi:hypothetical protein ACIUVZ_003409 [Yersinia enterocolitica]|nr:MULTISPECIES: hypothetical protein [Yersinia]EKN3387806.1 hypothetical protein [Yersinia enterocolitica]HDL7232052.1 hypothetical protein [Yersinia enterocolitica]HDL7355834.1 hypothetical protein [Yersinia enterocolitica]HDL8229704.1 hypothetical protein [Yersinia enterocolitica]HDM8313184.1 hypothetical protein [Yersinia enterocolitica]
MADTIKTSANTYAVISGEVIDRTNHSAKLELPWQGINRFGYTKDFKTMSEAIAYAKK